jgi:hypothetical protein
VRVGKRRNRKRRGKRERSSSERREGLSGKEKDGEGERKS